MAVPWRTLYYTPSQAWGLRWVKMSKNQGGKTEMLKAETLK